MDIYGAFQACCIGILAAPITVKLSKTYFNNPGRNTIFLWTILLLAGEHQGPHLSLPIPMLTAHLRTTELDSRVLPCFAHNLQPVG